MAAMQFTRRWRRGAGGPSRLFLRSSSQALSTQYSGLNRDNEDAYIFNLFHILDITS
jgi:hypothetical protein